MASKKKTYAQGEMRPLSALAKHSSSSPKKRTAPTRVPEPPKFPQYGSLAKTGNQAANLNFLQENKLQENANVNAPSADNSVNIPNYPFESAKNAFDDIIANSDNEFEDTGIEKITEAVKSLEPKAEPKPEVKLEPEIKSKPEPKPEVKPEPEIKSKPEPKPETKPEPETVKAPFVRKSAQPLPEYKQNVKIAAPARRRGTEAPDLSKKAERDAFFSKYTSNKPESKKTVRLPEITEEYIRQQEPVPKPKINKVSVKHKNPFLTKRTGGTVISHLKESSEPLHIGEKPEAEPQKDSLKEIQEILRKNIKEPVNIYVDKSAAKNNQNRPKPDNTAKPEVHADPPEAAPQETATQEMRENIESAVKIQRKEREEAKAKLSADEITDIQKKSSIIRSVGIISAITICGAFLLFGKRSDFSAEENRKLATMPEFSWSSYLNGEYTADLSAYYNDTVPMRSTFKRMISSMQKLKGLPSDEDKNAAFFGNVAVKQQDENTAESAADVTNITDVSDIIAESTSTKPAVTTAVTTTTELEEYEPPVEVGDSIIIYKKRAISFYGGLDSIAESYANTLNDFKKELPSVNVYSLIAPTSVLFYLPDEYKDYTASEKEKIDHANSYLKNVTPVDAYSVLEQHKDEAIYARTDHHWLPLGAYYAAQEFAKTAGVPFTDISDMKAETKEGYVGSMYTYTQSTILSENPEDFTYYKPKNRYKTDYYTPSFTFDYEGDLLMDITNYDPVGYYLVFMLGDDKIVHVSTDVDNDRTLVIFKDSYGNAMVPCLVGSFSDIYVCDIRYFEPNAAQFCKDVGATDLLFAMNTFSATGGNEDCIEQILYNQ